MHGWLVKKENIFSKQTKRRSEANKLHVLPRFMEEEQILGKEDLRIVLNMRK
jgi:hypothetical protein